MQRRKQKASSLSTWCLPLAIFLPITCKLCSGRMLFLQVIFILLCLMIVYIAKQLLQFRVQGLAVHGPSSAGASGEPPVDEKPLSEDGSHSD